ncbi:hypothetical protein SpAn4DRAFT_5211 [Sporomusa ovata]|uniref:Response regulatory domain-containing protein n=2 Tax=Sporomusa ovata TaxID=2378 RepID=A0A0U1KWY0_9FIRM|nr:hypothetical protein [Sporomusa ovata]CQR71970.1 hypothetical protein SpAn4DRAFT_5211 [Sporomusa ovata]
MPERNGWTVCQEICKSGTIPVIMLTAKSEEADQLYAFEMGGRRVCYQAL